MIQPLVVIARIHTDFPDKFGVPRQSGTPLVMGRIVMEPPYRQADAFRGIEEYSHLWLLWAFSLERHDGFAPMVRPPRLGGNRRMGVFATRSPNRPNPIGLSVVRLVRLSHEAEGPVLYVEGVDMVDGTPIYDIKPYLPYVDCVADALGGFGERHLGDDVAVAFACEVDEELQQTLTQILRQDPRPHYHEDGRVYGMRYRDLEVKFCVEGGTLTVLKVEKRDD